MYGLWLFKEIETEYGKCKVEIYRKDVAISNIIEIKALSANSIVLSLENLGSITDPIGKSVCSFSIIDTDQINYEDFFTPDATAFKVVVSTMVRGANSFTTRWSGFLTPDFFAENLSYRTPISLTARDNIGYLNDVDFDMPDSTVTVRQLIQAAFAKISDNYPMNLAFVSQKQTAEGVLAIDATISTALLREMSWYEAVETILHDLGLQMRWVDNNTIAVMDLSQIPEYYTTQGFNFINASGYREILPAWREFRQEQNYGAFDNFYRGQINGADKLEYAANSDISANVLLYQPAAKTQWAREGAIYFLNLFNSYNQYIDDNKAESIYVTGIAPTATNAEVLATKMVYSQDVTQVNKQIELKFNLNDTLRTPVESLYTRGEYNVFYLPYSTQTGGASGGVSQIKTPRPYQLKYRFNIFLRCKDGSNYVMREDWVDASTVNTEQPFIEFTTEKLKTANTNISDAQGNKRFVFTGYNNDEEYTITINSIPKAGVLEFVVYPWTFEGEDTAREADTYQRGAKISDIQFTVKLNTTGIVSGTLVGESHNVKSNYDYQFGQVPKFDGDLIAYAGGLFYGDTLTAINGFQRNADSTNYNLLELVGREVIHFNKKNYNKLSGTIKNLDKEPLMFNRLFVREGKTYAPFAYSLNVISNEMNITTMQEVEPYETASFTQIESEVTTGGATVSGGNNTVLQYSENAGNAKRVFELNAATETEKNDGYLLLDNPSFGEAKKVHISEVKDTQLRAEVEDLRNDFDELNAMLSDDTADVIDTWNEVVKFLEGYKESDNLASILSGMQSDFLTLQDNVGVIATNLSNLSVKVNDIDERVIALEELGLSLVVKDGKTYVRSKYNFYSDGGLTSGGIGSGGGGGTGGGSNVSYKGELSSGMLLGTITIDGSANKIYGPSVLSQMSNDVGYITSSALDGYLPKSGGTINGLLTVARDSTVALYIRNTQETNTNDLVLARFRVGADYGASIGSQAGNSSLYRVDSTLSNFYKVYDEGNLTLAAVATSGKYSDLNGLPTIPTELKSPYSLSINNSVGTSQITYDGSAAANLTLTKSMVGLGNVENTALSTWKGTSNITTVGTISSGVWNGTAITNTYINSVAWNKITSKPTTVSGYGITDMGSQTVASAGKLTTARSLWGNSFDGTKGFDGYLVIANDNGIKIKDSASVEQRVLLLSASNNLQIGYDTATQGYNTYIQGNSVQIRYGVSRTAGLILQSTGDIDIANSLSVGGSITMQNNKQLYMKDSNGTAFDVLRLASGNTLTIGYGTAGMGYNTYLSGWNVYLRYGTARTVGLTLNTSGNVIIGATTDNGGKLQVNGNIYATGGMTSGKASDRRLKDNILNILKRDSVNVLRTLRPVQFRWNGLAHSLDKRLEGDDIGFIADEFESIIPNSGRAIWDKYRAIEYDKCIPHLVLGWQIHEDRFETVEDRLAKAEGKIKELEEELKQYKTAA